MLGKSPNQDQSSFFKPLLKDFIDLRNPLVILSDKIPWEALEAEFAELYSHTGKPSKPLRLMAGLLILKQMFNLGDESLMPQWVQNPYFQYFCGESEFQWKPPCDPSDLVHFRKRIGSVGVEKIFEVSVKLQDTKEMRRQEIIIDTTAQEKNITYPTDAKLYRKVIEKCNKIAMKENIEQRQNYNRTVRKLKIKLRFAHHPKYRKEGRSAVRKLRTIAGRLTRELERKLPKEKLKEYQKEIQIFFKVLDQKQNDKNKLYSLHEPEVSCIAKGKSHKKYEFGSKVSFAMIPGSNIIVGIQNFAGNPHDSRTLESTINHSEQITGKKFKNAIVDRGYRGKKQVGETKIVIPDKPEKNEYQKRKKRKKCRSRAAIEPIIGHIKQDCRMARNYLKGNVGDEINALMAAAAFNFRHLLRKIEQHLFYAKFLFEIFLPKQVILIWFYLILPLSFKITCS